MKSFPLNFDLVAQQILSNLDVRTTLRKRALYNVEDFNLEFIWLVNKLYRLQGSKTKFY
jgi:hypothetical protein